MKFDTATRTDTGVSITGVSNRDDLAMDPSGVHMIAGGNHVIDLATDSITGTTGLTGSTAFDVDGLQAYVVQTSPDSAAVVDTDPLSGSFLMQIGTIDLSNTSGSTNPTEIAVDPTIFQAYVIQSSPDNIAFVDIDPGSLDYLTEIDTDADGTTTDANAPTGLTRAEPGGSFPVLRWISADSLSQVYVTDNSGSRRLSIIDASTIPIPASPLANIRIVPDSLGHAVTP